MTIFPLTLPGVRRVPFSIRALTVACALVVVSYPALASELSWKTVKNRGGVEVQQAVLEGSPIKVTRGLTVGNAGMFAVLAVLQDVESCSRWLHKCKEGRVIDKPAFNQAINYTVIDSPLMLKDRDSYIHSTVSYDADARTLRIDMVGVEDIAPPVKKRVRMLKFRGHWLIQERDDNTTHLTYQAHMDPQVVASGAANSTLVTSVHETMRRVGQLAQQAPYRDSEVPQALLDQAQRLNSEDRSQ